MKILIGVHHFPPRYTGGAELRAFRTATQIQLRGHEVKVICVEDDHVELKDGLVWHDTLHEGVPVRRLSFNITKAPDAFRYEYDNEWIGAHLHGFLCDFQPDIFHLFSGYSLTGRVLRVARAQGVPTVLTLTDYWFHCPRIQMIRSNGEFCTDLPSPERCAQCLGEERRRYRVLGKFIPSLMSEYWKRNKAATQRIVERRSFLDVAMNETDHMISPSKFLRKHFISTGISPERISYIRQGRDFPHLQPEHLQKEAQSDLRVGYIGQIARHKGVHILLDAVRRLPEAPIRVQVFGNLQSFPKYTLELQTQAEADSRIRLEGSFPKESLSRVLKALDLIVVPSMWNENSPNVIIEAFAHRTPVIASDAGGMAELVEHGVNGLLFKLGNPEDLSIKLKAIIDQPELLDELQQGIPAIKQVKEEIDELMSVYERIRLRSHGIGLGDRGK